MTGASRPTQSLTSTHAVASVLGAARDARTTAAAASEACQRFLPPFQCGLVRAGRVLAVGSGRPDAPLASCVAVLATANSAAALALELEEFARQYEPNLTIAAQHTCLGARLGILALEHAQALEREVELAHALAYAAHLAADALVIRAHGAETNVQPSSPAPPRTSFPASWKVLLAGLNASLTPRLTEIHAPGQVAAFAACQGALHLVRAHDESTPRGGADGAMWRFARLTALAAGYAGWALV